MENAVSKAIRILGPTLFQAAVKTGIQPTTLWKWAKAGRIKDGLRAVQIARLTGLSIEELVGAPPNGHPDGGQQEDDAPRRKTSVTSPAAAPAWSDSAATATELQERRPPSPGADDAPLPTATALAA